MTDRNQVHVIKEYVGVKQWIQLFVIKEQVGVGQWTRVHAIKECVGVKQWIQLFVIKEQVGVKQWTQVHVIREKDAYRWNDDIGGQIPKPAVLKPILLMYPHQDIFFSQVLL